MLLVVGVVGLGGCASRPLEKSVPSQSEQELLIMQKISDASVLAVNAQRELALTSDSKLQKEIALRRRLLTDVVNYDYYGDVEGILKDISDKYGYVFSVYGKKPPEGVNVNIYVSKKPVIEVLKQIGYTSNAVLDINLTRDVIELHYKTK